MVERRCAEEGTDFEWTPEGGLHFRTPAGEVTMTPDATVLAFTFLLSLATGVAIAATMEGMRALLVEVQALVDDSQLGNPRRVAVGLDQNRLAMLLAVLHRHGGVATMGMDVFLNVVGGVKVLETGSDLAVLTAVVSSLRNRALDNRLIAFGEVGLSGEIRPVPNGEERLKEAATHGFRRAIVPRPFMRVFTSRGLPV